VGSRLAGIVAGSVALLAAFFSYDVLFLDILPTGWVLPAGSLTMAAAFGLSANLRSLWRRVAVSAVGLALALTLTWGLYLTTFMSPLLFYEYTWSPALVFLVTLVVALPLAGLGNVSTLEIRPEDL